MFFVGVDVSKGRWLTVRLSEDESWEVDLFHSIKEIWDSYNDARLILIDIPIGLPESGREERPCDKEARRLLGWPRRSSVFAVPCRAALQASNYEDAKRINKDKTGKELSRQTWGIIPKIREVDDFLNENFSARLKIREIHPEVCFWALNGGKPMEFNKKEEYGLRERIEILHQVYRQAPELVNFTTQKYQGRVAHDDIVDALAAAVTALLGGPRLLTVTNNPKTDSKGLPMEMVYYLVS